MMLIVKYFFGSFNLTASNSVGQLHLKKAKRIIWKFFSGKRSIITKIYYYKYVDSTINLSHVFCLEVDTNILHKIYNLYEKE